MSTVTTFVEQIKMEFNGAMSKGAKILAITAVVLKSYETK
jgi:methionine-rich copper-binding protein CopC